MANQSSPGYALRHDHDHDHDHDYCYTQYTYIRIHWFENLEASKQV